MNLKHTFVVVLLVLAVLAGGMTAVAVAEDDDAPGMPASFYGDVTDGDDNPAPVGTEIHAVVLDDGEEAFDASITVEEDGQYGDEDPLEAKLSVDSEAGDEVRFHVDTLEGPEATETFDLEAEGDGTYELDLTFEDADFDIEDITLELEDTTLEPGQTTTATVTGEREDGETIDVTDQATIESSDTDVATVDDATVEALLIGETDIEAEFRGETDSVTLEVVDEADDDDDIFDDDPGDGAGGGGGGAAPSDDDAPVDDDDVVEDDDVEEDDDVMVDDDDDVAVEDDDVAVDDEEPEPEDDGLLPIPGFGPLVAIVALLGAAMLALRQPN